MAYLTQSLLLGALSMLSALLLGLPGAAADMSWIQAYNAGFVRVKARGVLKETFDTVDPGLLTSLNAIADCPATPATYPFPARLPGSRLNSILLSKKIVVARQALSFPAFEDAFINITREIVKEISQAYKVQNLQASFITFYTADTAVDAVLEGTADCTDPFYRQWTLTVDNQVQRSVQLTPACTLWASTLSISWNRQRNPWKNLEDLQAAGAAVIIPLYSTMLPFQADISGQLPAATLLPRPQQNFEGNVTELNTILNEFLDGVTTALLATKGDIQAVLPRANLDRPFPLDDLVTVQARVILPVGAFLPPPGPKPTLLGNQQPGKRCNDNFKCKSRVCIALENGTRGGQCL